MIEFERTKNLAKEKKISLREVNDKAKLGKNSIYKWKTNKPGTEALTAVAKILGTTTDYLNGLTDDPTPPTKSNAPTTFEDLGLPYKGVVPEDVNDMYRAIAKQYAEKHNLPKRDA